MVKDRFNILALGLKLLNLKKRKEVTIVSRIDILRRQRERVMISLGNDLENRAKWLVMLMDIDDEIEELSQESRQAQ